MNYQCPFCHTTHKGIEWDSATLKDFGENKINDFSDNDIESIEMNIPGYHYICPNCGADTDISDIRRAKKTD
ncbi:hypothetical protein Desor_1469 [Desulfosporosinus orientis DSM 765]|uniref:Uncharacterized protein n=1 Tax=Desulfosporosinus orientis (strain ATCC 19365 / DSM 765 / NCIMB 8382 / VKM B-1628 / Singapore I) TaxID=768706 RepID=G7WAR5_DESOD|nr:hypothetical protein [Desulfosporosinus orientis]AET67126.1 hypothetical protein Desor_1469 [Desulfosporosinus orientis DSM 765]